MILIIGATGLVGRELVRLLWERKARMRALMRTAQRAGSISSYGIEVIWGDLSRPDSLDSAFDGVERVFLLTPSHPRQVDWETNAIAGSKQAGVKFIVKLSTLGANEDSPIAMSRWHRQAELAVEKSGIAWTFLRPQHFMQNILALAPSIREHGVLRVPMKSGRMGLVDARDVAAVAAAVLRQPTPEHKIVRITGGERLSFQNLADTLTEAVGRPIRYQEISEEVCRAELRNSGAENWLIEDQIQIYRMFRELQTPLVNDTVERLTGNKPRTFADFARDHANTFRRH